MADEFQAEVCGGTWWSSSRSIFGSSPCSSSSSGILDLGSVVGWPTASFLDIKTTTTDESNSASDGSIVIQDSASNNTNMATGLSSSSTTTTTHEWDPTLISGRSDQSNYPPILQQDQNSSMNYRRERGVEDCPDEIQKDWRTTTTLKPNFSTIADHHHHHQDSSINDSFKSLGGNNQPLYPMISTNSSAQCAPCFPINSVSYGYSSNSLFDAESHKSVSQQSLNPNLSFMNYPSTTNYQASLINELSTCLPKLQQHPNHLQFPLTGQSFCNGSASAQNVFRPGFFPSTRSQFLAPTTNEKLNPLSLTTKANNDEVQGLGSGAKKTGSDLAFKRPRIETPSSLPTFKVRKEKLGDRITALQQLVSPFGKTDTASVLHEAIEYIKFLHDQVNVLSTPYMKNGSPIHRQQNSSEKTKGQEGSKEDLKSRGLCLVPLSSTFPVAAEATTDFWTPTFGGTFR